MLLSSLCFTFMNVFARMAGDIPAMQKSFFRNLISLAVAVFLLLRERKAVHLTPFQGRHLFFRCLLGTLGIVCNFYAVDHMLLSDATMLNKLSPFFTIIFTAWILKENVTLAQICMVCVAFGGSLFILKPSLSGLTSSAAVIALLGGAFAGLAYGEVRILGTEKVRSSVIIFAFSLFSCLFATPFLILDFTPMKFKQVICLLLAGVAATGGQFSITASYYCAPAVEVSVYDYSQIVFSAILGYIFWEQVADGLSLAGYTIICGTAIAMAIYNKQSNDKLTSG